MGKHTRRPAGLTLLEAVLASALVFALVILVARGRAAVHQGLAHHDAQTIALAHCRRILTETLALPFEDQAAVPLGPIPGERHQMQSEVAVETLPSDARIHRVTVTVYYRASTGPQLVRLVGEGVARREAQL